MKKKKWLPKGIDEWYLKKAIGAFYVMFFFYTLAVLLDPAPYTFLEYIGYGCFWSFLLGFLPTFWGC
ncbi:hypothetical protein [uncultured Phascolarctobacterium sp.]|uniref:hypothetical protein n=1 Tax=uncultured Phascolarctobacterium sp. TaxID=512296 RepID=UPI002635FB3C|nr:hypothetical protein [uncultured Phascolarctobacterium sp.]